jgi:putative Mn2+ efflux pump MntP
MGVLGYEIGRHAAQRFKTKIPEIIAGIILIGIGVKMLF